MKLEQKGILAGVIAALVISGGVYTAKILMDDVPRAANSEYMRMVNEQNDIMKVKCLEPMTEFRAAETKYLQTHGLLFHPETKYDILSIVDPKESQQYNDAAELKMVEDLAVQACVDAKAENGEIKQAEKWDYFKAHWKEMMFNVK